MTRTDGTRDAARRLAELNGSPRAGSPARPPDPGRPVPAVRERDDPPTVPLPLGPPLAAAPLAVGPGPSSPGLGPLPRGPSSSAPPSAGFSARARVPVGVSPLGPPPGGRDLDGAWPAGAPRGAGTDPAWPDADGGGSLDDAEHPLARYAEQEGRGSPEPGGAAPHGGRPSWARRVALRWLPPSLTGARVDPGRPGALALIAVVLVGAVVAGVGVWSNRPTAQPVGGLPSVTVTPAPGAAAPGGPAPADPVAAAPVTAGPLVVSVVGKVARPGLVRIPDGARVADAVDAAGGALPGVDLAVLNLARRVGDGEQIAIGVPPAADAAPGLPAPGGEPASGAEPGSATGGSATGGSATGGSASGGSTPGGAAAGGKVDLNRATAADLDALPGIGPVTATKIIDWRAANGRFSRIEQLREVDGIGERRFATLQPLVTV